MSDSKEKRHVGFNCTQHHPYKLKNIRKLLKEKNITCEKLAVALNTTRNHIYQICNGEVWCSEFDMSVIRRILKCAPDDIVDIYEPHRDEICRKKCRIKAIIGNKKYLFYSSEYENFMNRVDSTDDVYELDKIAREMTERVEELELCYNRQKKEEVRELIAKTERQERFKKVYEQYGENVVLKGLIYKMCRMKIDLMYVADKTGINIDKLVLYQAQYPCPIRDAFKIEKVIGEKVENLIEYPPKSQKKLNNIREIVGYAKLLYDNYREGSIVYSWEYAWARACCACRINEYYPAPKMWWENVPKIEEI